MMQLSSGVSMRTRNEILPFIIEADTKRGEEVAMKEEQTAN